MDLVLRPKRDAPWRLTRSESGVRRQSEAATALSATRDVRELQPRPEPERCRAPLATALQSAERRRGQLVRLSYEPFDHNSTFSLTDPFTNAVSAVITNLGTYAVAPPLPTGDLQLTLSANSLPADGVSRTTVTVTNLVLNTGNVATQQWLFTAVAEGVRVLNQDCDTNTPGVQVVSTNGALTLLLQAPLPYEEFRSRMLHTYETDLTGLFAPPVGTKLKIQITVNTRFNLGRLCITQSRQHHAGG